MSGDEKEYEYEESTVVVEIQGLMENDFLRNVAHAKVLGIETGKPLLQLDDYTFTGEFQDMLCSAMLFEEISRPKDPDNITASTKLELCGTANKKWAVKRVFLKHNKEGQQDSNAETSMEQNSDKEGDDEQSATVNEVVYPVDEVVSFAPVERSSAYQT
ncbi:general transcription factor 3C polypeptide 6-like [Dreissena polymorpha]|uniref:Transcription factor TFIIIC triple barrel domain-containing protein n=1 Tax=Dreissena polymorpha TaxID=45954 RepID=A0A9D4GSC1_DREPO|nr:general transcription factor 3C polypeptide 6-like [Dreissena polymorpha]KAH3819092.1 hypothetical protein DPMN_120823 [Dreissena polymorpha]